MAANPIALEVPTTAVTVAAAPTSASAERHVLARWLGNTLLAWPVPLVLLALWYLAARYEWVPPQVLPAPDAVLQTLDELYRSGELWSNLQVSALRVLGGFAVGLFGGLALGAAMGLSPRFRDYVYPTFKAFSQVPVLGWLPLLMLLVGIDEALKLAVRRTSDEIERLLAEGAAKSTQLQLAA